MLNAASSQNAGSNADRQSVVPIFDSKVKTLENCVSLSKHQIHLQMTDLPKHMTVASLQLQVGDY
jgi:hypothetical protein